MRQIGRSLLLLCVAAPAWALDLGEFVRSSYLGEPLRAQIALQAAPSENLSGLSVELADEETYRARGMQRPWLGTPLRMEVVRELDKPVLQIETERPPELAQADLILDVRWKGGRILKHYGLTLGAGGETAEIKNPAPPVASVALPQSAVPHVAAPAVGTPAIAPEDREPARSYKSPDPVAATPPIPAPTAQASATVTPATPVAPPPAPVVAAPKVSPANIQVRKGDTLNAIARRLRASGVMPDIALKQGVRSLYAANPQAFIGGNIDRLRTDASLVIPEASAWTLSEPAALRRTPEKRPQEAHTQGRVTTARAEKSPAAAPHAVLRLSQGAAPNGASVSAGQGKAAVGAAVGAKPVAPEAAQSVLHSMEENAVALTRQIKEANARVKQLEAASSDMQKLLALQAKPPLAQPNADSLNRLLGQSSGQWLLAAIILTVIVATTWLLYRSGQRVRRLTRKRPPQSPAGGAAPCRPTASRRAANDAKAAYGASAKATDAPLDLSGISLDLKTDPTVAETPQRLPSGLMV